MILIYYLFVDCVLMCFLSNFEYVFDFLLNNQLFDRNICQILLLEPLKKNLFYLLLHRFNKLSFFYFTNFPPYFLRAWLSKSYYKKFVNL